MPARWYEGLVEAFPIPDKVAGGKVYNIDVDGLEVKTKDQDVTSYPACEDFPFLDLPPEIRNKIYHLVLFSTPSYRGIEGRRRASRLSLLLVNNRLHQEASYVLYTTESFRVFKLQDFIPLPAIQELPAHYRMLVTNLELRVGSSWTNPPRSWRVSKLVAKCLSKMPAVRLLKIFVECDPSDPIFINHRISYDFYTNFCGDLLKDTLKVMPQLKFVELDGNPGVNPWGPLTSRLRKEAEGQDKTVLLGNSNDWQTKWIKRLEVK